MTATSVLAVRYVLATNDKVVKTASISLAEALTLNAVMERRIADYRAYVLTGSAEWLDTVNQDRTALVQQIARVRATLDDTSALRLTDAVSAAETRQAAVIDDLIA